MKKIILMTMLMSSVFAQSDCSEENYQIYNSLLKDTNVWLELEKEIIRIGGNYEYELGEA